MLRQILAVGGTFDLEGGRSSGYFRKLTQALAASMPTATLQVLNGGTYAFLRESLESARTATHLLWFADVPNELPKLLPAIKARSSGLVLVSSKNNRRGLYSRTALFERMRNSRSELLVEFAEAEDGKLVASVLATQGDILLDRSPSIDALATSVVGYFQQLTELRFPLQKRPFPTCKAESFRQRDLSQETEIPFGAHPGAFGVARRHHTHEGVDLYGMPGDPVFAMESGVVVARSWFTGELAGSAWWGNTECLLVEGAHGILNYGEVAALQELAPGHEILAGQKLGELATVIKRDKGRPRTMLHIERYARGTIAPCKEWPIGSERPLLLCDPTSLLVQARKWHD